MIILLWTAILYSQGIDTLWTKTYGGPDDDEGRAIAQTSNQGYMIVGWKTSISTGSKDIYLIKTDADGDTLWTKTYGGTDAEYGVDFKQTGDGGWIILGETFSYGAGFNDIYIIRTDSLGDTLWTKIYGGTYYDKARAVTEAVDSDNGYLIVGATGSFGNGGNDDLYILRIDSLGDTLWTKTYGGLNWDWASSVQPTADSAYIIIGATNSYGAGYFDVYLIKINASGELLWQKTFGGTGDDRGEAVCQTSDQGYIITGMTRTFGAGGEDLYLIKTDSLGTIEWQKVYGGAQNERGYSLLETEDGGYIIAGYTMSFGAGEWDVYLLKTDEYGDTLWTQTYGGMNGDLARSILKTQDGGYIIVGNTESFGAGAKDVFVLKTAPELEILERKNPCRETHLLQAEPDPFTKKLTIKIDAESGFLEIYDAGGRLIKEFKNRTRKIIWDGTDRSGERAAAGVYFLRFSCDDSQILKKIIMLK